MENNDGFNVVGSLPYVEINYYFDLVNILIDNSILIRFFY